MTKEQPLDRIRFPEIIIGLVAPVGVDLTVCRRSLRHYFESSHYRAVEIKVTDVFPVLEKYIKPDRPLAYKTSYERISSYIKYGDQLRSLFDNDQLLAVISIIRLISARAQTNKRDPKLPNVYILYQFKRREEIELLRSVYGRCFFQVSAYSRRGTRVESLSRRFAKDDNNSMQRLYRSISEQLVQTDEDEIDDEHGQRVSQIFHDADVIINYDTSDTDIQRQIRRFCDLLFGSNKISPTKDEYGMFAAKAAAVRSLDLSRQVGAAIFTSSGEIISVGSNEVPKAGGGTYWCDDNSGFDDRDYSRGYDSNDKRKRELLLELLGLAGVNDPEKVAADRKVRSSQFMDALEYGRIIHAEMSALCDAARLGLSVKDATLYTTTFPCHICTKHIIAAGIKRVVFLEPYPKSLASELHGDAVRIEGADRGKFEDFPFVDFTHFYGISHRRYRETFERTKRKDRNGDFVEWKEKEAIPLIDLKFPFYYSLENQVAKSAALYLEPLGVPIEEITGVPFG